MRLFTLEPGEFDEEVFESLSSWTKEKIQGSEGFSNLRYAAQGTEAIGTGKDDGRIDLTSGTTNGQMLPVCGRSEIG